MQKDPQQQAQSDSARTDNDTILQSNLFGAPTVIAEPPDPAVTPFPPLVRTNPLTDQSSLAACALPYRQELLLRGKSNYTVTCFLSDLKMFCDFAGQDTPVGRTCPKNNGAARDLSEEFLFLACSCRGHCRRSFGQSGARTSIATPAGTALLR